MNIDILSKLIAYKDIFEFLPDLEKYYQNFLQLKDQYHCTQEPFKILLKKYHSGPDKLKYVKLKYDKKLTDYVLTNKSQIYYPRMGLEFHFIFGWI